ncbi:aspartate carbamoyltransferase regulatory subunit [Carboxylicivirga sp. M1479]|uniref:aspartate carbamoyltransferase regulatory subunit n=1 Tax=Carboxylicivirga sp. M1479 TaxID=2594476 RepID=UPI001178AEC7|nr:aspartate carbamoyltransferase regulatory subunit [Carboxylicivirga sp. M1479]TRX70778.1 aspartate carbamoyltransferase regulatory subunit [Carboxylicivirga sp. M1479]
MTKKELSVRAIKNGTVIDHIPATHLFKVISILGLDKIENQITFGTNLKSKQQGHKAIIKVAKKFFADDEINKIALVAPFAKLNIIEDYQVVDKKVVELPDEVVGIVKCFNPKCITNNEEMVTKFSLVEKQPLALKCNYCEKITNEEHLEVI